ncbi:MAG: acyl-CoA mutase large subunit family protein, partial [Candidatus Delongbacteria bacterium]|nr:acyl-CoA mutase large subunit family protein [Candidatus Delongbacteria bacterium]
EFASDKTKNAWMEEVLKDLKGKTYDKIWWKTYEGFELEPYYKGFEIENINIAEDSPGEFPYIRSNKPVETENSWTVRQEISNSDPETAKDLIAEAIKGGAEGIDLKLNGGLTSGKPGCIRKCGCSKGYFRGIVINSKNDFTGLFNSVDNEKYSVNIEAGVASKEIFDMFKDTLKGDSKGSIDNDPLKELALNGEYAKGEVKRFEEMKSIFDACRKYPDFKGLVISNDHFHDSGSTIVQKVAYLLSTAVFYKEKIAPEISFSEFSKNIELSHSIGQYYLLEIAGLRALRLLWSNIAEAYDNSENVQPVDIHTKTGLFNKTAFDPYVNMLRTTTEAMSAITGGCNSLTVLPYNICVDEADSFSMRIARNTQLILRDEAHFDKFIDPSKGSYYIEKATDLIAKDAWKLFRLLEENGGIYEALKRGEIQRELNELKKKRLSNFSMRRDNLVGTNFVPNYAEKSVCTGKKENIPEQNSDIFSTELYKISDLKIENISLYRLSEEFEKHRKLTMRYNRENDKKVTAFMATVGNPAMRKARASFAAGYLAAGGFDIIDNTGFKDADEAVKEAFISKAEIIVICSSDDEYPQVAPEIASKIKSVRPGAVVILAGYPKDIIEDLKKAGVDEFIHLRSDSIETIKSIQTKLGILK